MIDLNSPSLYTNRELSWLQFNSRVLKQSGKASNPLLERLKFIAIYSTNLDEFYMIRVAGLKELYSARVNTTSLDNMTAKEQLDSTYQYLKDEKKTLEKMYKNITLQLERNGLIIDRYRNLSDELKQKADAFFFENIFPVIIPIAVDSTHPFPPLNNLSLSLAIKLQDNTSGYEDSKFALDCYLVL